MDEEPAFGDALDFILATDLSPSDQFMAAIMWSLYEAFQFLFCFLAQVATKTHTLVVFYGVLNSIIICYLGCSSVSWSCG